MDGKIHNQIMKYQNTEDKKHPKGTFLDKGTRNRMPPDF
jgi:hypothetical protein